MSKKRSPSSHPRGSIIADVGEIIDASRRTAARSVNAVMTATYWAVGRRIAEQEQRGSKRAPMPDDHLAEIAAELGARFGRGYSVRALRTMRSFYAAYAHLRSAGRALEQPVDLSNYFNELRSVAAAFSLSWSHYVRLVRVSDPNARAFYECEALSHGWTVRQLVQQIRARLYERTAAARDAGAVRRAALAAPMPPPLPDEMLRDPYLRRFFDVPPYARGTRASESFEAWLARAMAATHARETGPVGLRLGGGWLQ